MDLCNSRIKTLIVGGEDLKVDLARRIFKVFGSNVDIYNEYGPTETVVGCIVHKYSYEEDRRTSVPIGRPINNTQIYVVNQHMEPVGINTIGEICIAGDGLARGYYNNTELTKEKFVDNPGARKNGFTRQAT